MRRSSRYSLGLAIASVYFSLASTATGQYPNVRVSDPQSTNPEEVTIAINPVNPLSLAAAANINYYYYSMDGGQSWTQGLLSSPLGVAGDPSVIYDAEGNLYYGHLSNPPTDYWLDRIVVQKSEDGGISWNQGSGMGLNPPKQQDKEWLAADMTTSPYRNYVYSAWTEFDRYGSTSPLDSSRILFSRSTDSGQSWSVPVRVSDVAGNAVDSDSTVEGAVPAVGPNGEVYTSWAGPLGIMFDRSFDGGVTFGDDIFVSDQPGGWDFNVPGIFRCNGLPITACDISSSPYRGNVYVLWSDQRDGIDNTNVFITRSVDGGSTWAAAKRVNNNPNTSQQFFPWMTVDPRTGVLWVVFYDRRNTNGDATEVFVAKSVDGGETFENFRVSESPFTPRDDVFFGDYINIAARDGSVYPIWMRMDNTTLSVWTALIRDTTQVHVAARSEIPADFTLSQNFPNPFNQATTISFNVRRRARVSIRVYALTGELVRELADAVFEPGEYSTRWEGIGIGNRPAASGVYLLRMRSGDERKTRRMVLLR